MRASLMISIAGSGPAVTYLLDIPEAAVIVLDAELSKCRNLMPGEIAQRLGALFSALPETRVIGRTVDKPAPPPPDPLEEIPKVVTLQVVPVKPVPKARKGK